MLRRETPVYRMIRVPEKFALRLDAEHKRRSQLGSGWFRSEPLWRTIEVLLDRNDRHRARGKK